MKAAVLEQLNSPLVVAEVGLTPLQFGQVLVKVLVSGICGAQLLEIGGHKGNAKFLPHLMGHEGCGIVEEVGPGVTKVKKGDKVVMHWRPGSGVESDFPEYEFKGKRIKSGKVTTFSEYSICSENRITLVPQDTPEDLAALLGCSLSTALGTINEEAQVKFGESIMIVGAGGLGINLIKAAQLAGAYPIISVDIHDSKKELALSMGAHLFVNTARESLRDALATLGLKDVDVIIECSGAKVAIEQSVPLLSGIGRFVMVGQPKPGESIELSNANHMFGGEGKRVLATQGGRFNPSRDIPRYVRMAKAGVLKTDGIITHRVALDDINTAIDLVRAGQASRILVDMRPATPSWSLRDAYKKMLALRVASEELVRHYLDNKVYSMVHFYIGQEAVAVGACSALGKDDLAMGTHRSHGYYLAKGGDLKKLVAELFGRKTGAARGKGGSMHLVDRSAGFAGTTPLLGSVVPIAAGQAFAKKYKKEPGVVVAFYGDGASEEGVVYETYNLAALYKVPLLLVLENNSWSINSHVDNRRAAGYDIEKVATGLGMRYARADGNDYEDVAAKAAVLVDGIRAGKGPAVLECMVYRHMAHSTPLMEEKYRKGDVAEVRLNADPIANIKQKLLAQGVPAQELANDEEMARTHARDSVAWALAQPYPDSDDLSTDVYA